jgi:aryl-alcohol dehydrogenase-like predicted oxidoreductase
MTLGHAADLPDTSEAGMFAQACAVLDAGYAAGVRHLDTARSYGTGEHFAARWLAARGHRDVVVSSKWGYRYTAGWQTQAPVHEVKDLSLGHLKSQWAESIAALGPALRVYQIHSVTLQSGVLDDGAVLDQLALIRDGGVAVGLSATGADQAGVVRKAMTVERGGRRLFDWVQATWNLLEPSVGPALAEARAAGLRVILKESLANGRLTERGAVEPLLAAARARGTTPDALALAVTLSQPFADVVLLGAATVAQLQSNLKARTLDAAGFSLPPEPAEAYWAERQKLAWT